MGWNEIFAFLRYSWLSMSPRSFEKFLKTTRLLIIVHSHPGFYCQLQSFRFKILDKRPWDTNHRYFCWIFSVFKIPLFVSPIIHSVEHCGENIAETYQREVNNAPNVILLSVSFVSNVLFLVRGTCMSGWNQNAFHCARETSQTRKEVGMPCMCHCAVQKTREVTTYWSFGLIVT